MTTLATSRDTAIRLAPKPDSASDVTVHRGPERPMTKITQ
jgi:hypothetical protein